MAKSSVVLWTFVGLMCLSAVNGLSVQTLSTTKGNLRTGQPAIMDFTVVNTDMSYGVEFLMQCTPPPGVQVSFDVGGLRYDIGGIPHTPHFTLDVGPAQSFFSLIAVSGNEGENEAQCTLRYIPYRIVQGAGGQEERIYLTPTGAEIDSYYEDYTREIKLDKPLIFESTAPVVGLQNEAPYTSLPVNSPETVSTNVPGAITINANYLLIGGAVVVLLVGVFLIGKRSSKTSTAREPDSPREPVEFCPFCGHRLGTGDAYCLGCGKRR